MANTISPIRTNVPQPVFGDKGYIAPEETDILAGVQADINASFGGNLNFTTTAGGITNPTPQGQMANSITAILGEINDKFLKYQNMVDPAYSSGRMQDAIGRIYYIERFPSKPTVIQVICNGLSGVNIPLDTLIQDNTGQLFKCNEGGTIGVDGTVTLSFSCSIHGPVPVPIHVSIYQAIPGWDDVTLVSGVVGNNIETRTDFESRRALSTAQNSMGMIPSIRGAVASLPDVIDVFAYSNDSSDPLAIGGIVMPPNSIFVCVEGGSSTDIATEIWKKKMPGCTYYPGNVVVTIEDTEGYVPPYPSYQVIYQVPNSLQIVMAVSLVNNQYVPSDVADQVKDAIINAFAGGDGLPRAKIAGELLASRYYDPVLALGTTGLQNWVQIVSIQVGSINSPEAQFGGSIYGNTLTVQSMVSGELDVGQTLMDSTGKIVSGTVITSKNSGTGGIGTYGVSKTQTVGLELMYGVLANENAILPNFDQIPTITADLITVTIV